MAEFAGKLNSNEIFAALYNMIISQQVFADNIAGTNAQLVDKARVDGSLYGDQNFTTQLIHLNLRLGVMTKKQKTY